MNDKQRVRLANILTNIGQILFAASVIAPFFQGIQVSLIKILLGMLMALVFFGLALFLEKGG